MVDAEARKKERFLSAQGDPFAGSEWGKKKSTRSVRNDGGVLVVDP
jgi:hypothetical protein